MSAGLETDDRRSSARQELTLCGGGIILATLLAYANSFYGVFVFDDNPNIVENASIRSFSATWHATPDEIPSGLWRRPVGRWSFALNYAVSRLQPWSYHAFNVAVHIAAGLLLFGVIRRTLLLPGIPDALRRESTGFAWSAALLWTLHPLQTESVTYIVQRLESMMGLCYLGCLYCVLRGARSACPVWWYVAAIAACCIGMGCKEVMVTAPLVVLLFDRIFLGESFSQVVQKRGWVHAAHFASTAYPVWLTFGRYIPWLPAPPRQVGYDIFLEVPDRWSYLLTQPGVVLHYVGLALWPEGQCFDCLWPLVRTTSSAILPAALVLSLVGASVWGLRSRPRLSLVGLVFFVILAPTSTIIPLRVAFEHRMYLSLACLVVLVLLASHATLQRLISDDRRRRFVSYTSIAIVAVLLGAVTHARNTVYYSRIAFYTDNVLKAPHNMLAFLNLSNEYLEAGDYETALALANRAVQLEPDDARARMCLGNTLIERGSSRAALLPLQKAVRLKPDYAAAHHRLAIALNDVGQWEQAERRFREAVRLHPTEAQVRNDFAVALTAHSRLAEAEDQLRQAIARWPESSEAHNNLGSVIMMRNGSVRQAIKHFQEAVRLDPASADARHNLRRALAMR